MSEDREPTSKLVELSEADCWSLMAGQAIGRLAVVDDGQPIVLPVNYTLDGHAILIRTGPGTKLTNASLDRVAFEVDQLDPDHQIGWSVLVQGVGVDTTEAIDSVAQREQDSDVESWADGLKPNRIRIVQPRISGRRILRGSIDGRDG